MTEDIHKLSGAYALDALDDLERARFEKHLNTCEDCRAEVAGLREAAAKLAVTTAATPPPALRDKVLAGITQVRPLPPPAVPEPVREARRPWFPLLVAAAIIAIVSVGAAVWQPWSQNEQALTATEQVLRAPDAEQVSVDLGETGRATLVRSVAQAKAVLVTEDLAPAPEGKVYQLWLQQDGAMVPAGLMPEGGPRHVLLEGDAASATAAGITIEPPSGSPEPTTKPIALFDFAEAV